MSGNTKTKRQIDFFRFLWYNNFVLNIKQGEKNDEF